MVFVVGAVHHFNKPSGMGKTGGLLRLADFVSAVDTGFVILDGEGGFSAEEKIFG